jgi:DNA-nicking Smr family endonuclease
VSARRPFPPHRPLQALGAKARVVVKPRAPAGDTPKDTEPIFAHVAAATGVVPLGEGPRRVPAARERAVPRTTRHSEFSVSSDDAWVEGVRRDLGKSALLRLRGTPRATLDLHGLRVARAERELATFLVSQSAAGASLVLVIVGKGRHSPGGDGVLRGAISDWLTTGAGAVHVLAFRTAPPALGGGGGVLVLLKSSARR